jgi:hypothetical protein
LSASAAQQARAGLDQVSEAELAFAILVKDGTEQPAGNTTLLSNLLLLLTQHLSQNLG